MEGSTLRRARRAACAVAAALAVSAALVSPALAAYDPSDPVQKAEHDAAQEIGVQAYKYGLPLLDMNRIFSTFTSVNVCDPVHGFGPVNQLCSTANLADPTDRTVPGPNHDTLYTNGWLDLSGHKKYVLHVPSSDRFHVFELIDEYTNNFANIGTPIASLYPDPTARPYAYPDGDYIVLGPNQTLDPGENSSTCRSSMPPPRASGSPAAPRCSAPAMCRTSTRSRQRTDSQHSTSTCPARRSTPPPPPKTPITTPTVAHIPGTAPGENPVAFFDALGDQLAKFPPPAADRPLLTQLATVGIGPGLHPSATQDNATLAGLSYAVTTAGPAAVNLDLRNALIGGFAAHNGWLVADLGSYGTDYATRAWADKLGAGALDSRVATYPLTQTDRLGHPLTGATRYVAHFAPGTAPPPVQGFWSMTLYDKNGFLVPNSANRYVLNDRSTLHYNPDGSLDIYIQPGAPANPTQYDNWLPSPPAGDPTNPGQAFNLIMRLYAITPSAFSGVIDGGGNWTPPSVLPCDETTNTTATGIACAS